MSLLFIIMHKGKKNVVVYPLQEEAINSSLYWLLMIYREMIH